MSNDRVTVVQFEPYLHHVPIVVSGGLANAYEYVNKTYSFPFPLSFDKPDVPYTVRLAIDFDPVLHYLGHIYLRTYKLNTIEVISQILIARLNVTNVRSNFNA